MPAPKIEYGVLAPVLIVLAGAVIAVLVEAFVSRRYRYVVQTTLSFSAIGLKWAASSASCVCAASARAQ